MASHVIQWKDYIRPAACASVSLLALSVATSAQAQQYQRAPSVEVNLQALQALRFSADEAQRFAVSAPQKLERGSIQATKLYPPGYTGKREVSKVPLQKAAPAPVKKIAAPSPAKPVVAPVVSAPAVANAQPKPPVRQAQSGYIPPVGNYVPMPRQTAQRAEVRKIPPQNIPQVEVRKTPELNKAMQAAKVRVQAPVPVYEAPERTAPVVAREVVAAPARVAVAPKTNTATKAKTAKGVLHDMMDMPAKTQLFEAKAPIVKPPVEQPVVPKVREAAPLPPVELPVTSVKTEPKLPPKAAPLAPASDVPKKPVSVASPVIYEKKLLPAIQPKEREEPGVALPKAVLESLQPMDSAHPIMKAESKITRKELFDAPPKQKEITAAQKAIAQEPISTETELDVEDIRIPSFEEVPEIDFEMPEIATTPPAPQVEKEMDVVVKKPNDVIAERPAASVVQAEVADISKLPEPQPPLEPTPQALIASLPDFETLDPTPKKELPPLSTFDDPSEVPSGPVSVVSPVLPSLDALTEEEDIEFEPINVADSKVTVPEEVEVEVRTVPQPVSVAEPVGEKAKPLEVSVPELPKVESVAVEKTAQTPEPEIKIEIPELPELPSFQPVSEPIAEVVLNEAEQSEVRELSEVAEQPKVPEGVNELLPDFELPEPPAAPVELAALPDLNDIAPKLPEAPEIAPAAAQITFGKGEKTVEQGLEQRIMQVAEEAKAGEKNIQVIAYASGGAEEASTARRISLARALDIRALLIQNGISEDRISLQALGNREANSEDRADIFLK